MLTSAPKSIRENIARAKGYLRRDEVERALVTMSEAVRQLGLGNARVAESRAEALDEQAVAVVFDALAAGHVFLVADAVAFAQVDDPPALAGR